MFYNWIWLIDLFILGFSLILFTFPFDLFYPIIFEITYTYFSILFFISYADLSLVFSSYSRIDGTLEFIKCMSSTCFCGDFNLNRFISCFGLISFFSVEN